LPKKAGRPSTCQNNSEAKGFNSGLKPADRSNSEHFISQQFEACSFELVTTK
jgi:hypothetical protein